MPASNVKVPIKTSSLTATLVHHAALVTLGNATSPNTSRRRLNHGSATSPSRVVTLAPFPWLKSPTRVEPLSTWTTAAQHGTEDIFS